MENEMTEREKDIVKRAILGIDHEKIGSFVRCGVDYQHEVVCDVKMVKNISKLESFPPGNPFLHDCFNMGQRMGENLTVMFSNHDSEPCKHLIFCNEKTGERFCVEFNMDEF